MNIAKKGRGIDEYKQEERLWPDLCAFLFCDARLRAYIDKTGGREEKNVSSSLIVTMT